MSCPAMLGHFLRCHALFKLVVTTLCKSAKPAWHVCQAAQAESTTRKIEVAAVSGRLRNNGTELQCSEVPFIPPSPVVEHCMRLQQAHGPHTAGR